MRDTAVELDPHASLAAAAYLSAIFETQVTAVEVAKEGDMGGSPIFIDVREAAQVAVDCDAVDVRPQHLADKG